MADAGEKYKEGKKEKEEKKKAYPIIGRETHVVKSCLHNPIDSDLLEDGVRRSSTRKDERSNDGPHIESVHGSVLGGEELENKKRKGGETSSVLSFEDHSLSPPVQFPLCNSQDF